MDIEIIRVTKNEKDILWKLLQFSLYDSSFYISNKIDEKGIFEYRWFDNYFIDNDRYAFFLKSNNDILGFVMVNQNLKVKHNCQAQSIAEFLILPSYRKNYIGKLAAYKIFDTFLGEWEVQPMENNSGAYIFWEKIISEYSNNNYKKLEFDDMEDIFVFKSKRD